MEEPTPNPRVSWEDANTEAKMRYRDTLATKLDNLSSIKCSDVTCKPHEEEMEEYTMAVLKSMESSAEECLPSRGGSESKGRRQKKRSSTPGWNDHV